VIEPESDGESYCSRFSLDGKRADVLVFDSTAGAHYQFAIAAFNNDTPDASGGSASTKIERRIPGDSPSPPAPPTPPQPTPPNPTPPTPPAPTPPAPTPPAPEPQVPEGRFKISRRVFDAARSVPSTQRAAEAREIAAFLDGVASDIEDGKTRGLDAYTKALTGGMSSKFTSDQSRQWVGFTTLLGRIIYDLYTSGALGTWQDWVALLQEIIAALRLVS